MHEGALVVLMLVVLFEGMARYDVCVSFVDGAETDDANMFCASYMNIIDIALHEPTLYILTAFCRQKIINCASYILKTSYIKSISNSTQYPHDMKKYRWYTY